MRLYILGLYILYISIIRNIIKIECLDGDINYILSNALYLIS